MKQLIEAILAYLPYKRIRTYMMEIPRWSRLAIAISTGWLIALTGFLLNDYYRISFCLETSPRRALLDVCEVMFWSWEGDWDYLTLDYKRLIVIALTPVVLVWFYFLAIIWVDSSFKKMLSSTLLAKFNNVNIVTNKNNTSRAQYPWGKVLICIVVIFIAGCFGVTPPDGTYGNAAIAYKVFFALLYAVVVGLIFGVYKYFRR